jgi:5-methylcytosine-specific restriction endonuclease McrA
MNRETYSQYIGSVAWRAGAARLGELAASGFRCRLCNSNSELEVHHRTYERFGHEDAGDLTTLCRGCHHAVTAMLRERGYARHHPLSADIQRPLSNALPLVDPTWGEIGNVR